MKCNFAPWLEKILGGNNAFNSSSPPVDVSQEGPTLGSLAAITNVAISQVVCMNIARSSISSESSFTSRDTRKETSQPRYSRLSLRGRRVMQPKSSPLQRLHSSTGSCLWYAQRTKSGRNKLLLNLKTNFY